MADTEASFDQVVVRALEPGDFQALRDIYAQPRACHWTLQMPLPSADQWRQRLANANPNRYGLVACVNDRVVGNLGLTVEANPRRRHVANVGMGVHDAYAGRGIGRALMEAALDLADNWLGVSRVELTVFVDNDRAIRLYEGFGFVTEGCYRRFAMRHGALVDALAMARLREG